ncbi:tyrosine-protein phosphatase MSG5-like [Varroa destructor]|uniref:Protein-tyrosine-phosphatase n=1 Tax=Varroa destructor TaxID=109461 RepID=A0A7M7JYU3_VARDE|nr:tyrosine-protein phosphatase MSG5-like [Varroa destructor]
MAYINVTISVSKPETFAGGEQPGNSFLTDWQDKSSRRNQPKVGSSQRMPSVQQTATGSNKSSKWLFDEKFPISDDLITTPTKRRPDFGRGKRTSLERRPIREKTFIENAPPDAPACDDARFTEKPLPDHTTHPIAEDGVNWRSETEVKVSGSDPAFTISVEDEAPPSTILQAVEDSTNKQKVENVEELDGDSQVDVSSDSDCECQMGNFKWHNMSKIMDNLFLCGYNDFDVKKLRKHGITLVVNTTRDLPDRLAQGVTYQRYPANDTTVENIGRYFDAAADRIHNEIKRGGKVLVHCLAGVSRSCSIVLAYLVKHCNMSLLDAFHFVRRRRRVVSPNKGFFQQLIDFERRIRPGEEPSVRMVRSKKLWSMPDIYCNESMKYHLL